MSGAKKHITRSRSGWRGLSCTGLNGSKVSLTWSPRERSGPPGTEISSLCLGRRVRYGRRTYRLHCPWPQEYQAGPRRPYPPFFFGLGYDKVKCLRGATFGPVGNIEGDPCYVIKENSGPVGVTMWISKKSKL